MWVGNLAWVSASYLMTCDTPGSDVWTEGGGQPHGGPGLVKGHAYSLLQVKTVSTGVKLLNIRNPWGRFVSCFRLRACLDGIDVPFEGRWQG